MKNNTKYTINDLPQFSRWPKLIIESSNLKTFVKSPEELIREYERDKYQPLLATLKKLKKKNLLLKAEEIMFSGNKKSMVIVNGSLQIMPMIKAREKFLIIAENIIKDYLPSSTLVELGAGWGSVILNLAKKKPFKGMKLIAGEYVKSGIELISYIAQSEGVEVTSGFCDITSKNITSLDIPQNSIICTIFATVVPFLSDDFVKWIISKKPKVVVHFDPMYEHQDDDSTLLGLLQKKYYEINDFTKNLVTLIKKHEKKGNLKILKEQKNIFGLNPLLPGSVLVWEPVYNNKQG